MEADFSGYASKNDLLCSDGRTIRANAFAHQDKIRVPLVWQHQHSSAENVLGHAILENRKDGVYCYGFFNETPQGESAKTMVAHGDVDALSIFANKLVQQGGNVMHGDIKEVSLVLAGANPGAFIDQINIIHGDQFNFDDGEAIIYTGEALQHENLQEGDPVTDSKTKTTDDRRVTLEHDDASKDGPTVQEVVDSMTPIQRGVMFALVEEGAEKGGSAQHGDLDGDNTDVLAHMQEGFEKVTNMFEQAAQQGAPAANTAGQRQVLTHDQLTELLADAKKPGMTLGSAILAHVDDYGIGNIDLLFPDAKTVADSPDFVSRRMDWVEDVLSNTKHVPFSRIKSLSADITVESARAKGYIKGNMKKEEFFALAKRVTTPATVYKKQKLDRDDILDVTTLDVVAWMKAEMRIMLDEEIARAILVGDGREIDDEDKVKEPANTGDGAGIRSIAYDADFYAKHTAIAGNTVGDDLIDAVVRAMIDYKGSGNPTLYTTLPIITDLLLTKDKWGRRLYPTRVELAAAFGVKNVVDVEVMQDNADVFAIIVNLQDYSVGTDAGGEVSYFDFFDIDFNQNKYLLETRLSGALTKPASAIVLTFTAGDTVLAAPVAPTFVSGTGVVTIAAQTGYHYYDEDTDAVLTGTAQTPIASGTEKRIIAKADAGYHFPHNVDTDFTFTRP